MSSQPIFGAPPLLSEEREVVRRIEEMYEQLRGQVAGPAKWVGGLRRIMLARAVQGSNSIEGYNASLDEAVAAVDGEDRIMANIETWRALRGYQQAMTYVLQLAQDSPLVVDEGTLKSLHFMMIQADLGKSPGRWRSGPIFVHDERSEQVVYAGPDADRIPSLIDALLDSVNSHSDGQHPLIRAAMAHLNLVMIHPYRDGNGRMGRCVQTLVLARDRIIAPVFFSIEEYLGRNTTAYYDVLATVGGGSWNPDRDTRPWIRFCLTAHYYQAASTLRLIQATEQLWVACGELAQNRGLPPRVVGALVDAAQGLRIRRAGYHELVEISGFDRVSDLMASRDLRALCDARLLKPFGEKRGRFYLADTVLKMIALEIAESNQPVLLDSPFDAEQLPGQLTIEGSAFVN